MQKTVSEVLKTWLAISLILHFVRPTNALAPASTSAYATALHSEVSISVFPKCPSRKFHLTQWRIQKILVGGGILSTKPQKFGCLHQNWEWFFGRNRKFKRFFRPKSGGLQKKKKKRSSPVLRAIFRPDSLRLGWWGGDASRNGAELFEIEADFSAKIVTFRLVEGDASPP